MARAAPAVQQLVLKLIESVEVFAALTQVETVKLLETAEKRSFHCGEVILEEKMRGTFFYILIDGRGSVCKGAFTERVELAQLSPGASFGEMALVGREPRSASVVALDPCVLLRIDEEDCWRDPTVAAKLFRNIARVVSRRLREMDEAYLWGKRGR
ncbi:MAG: cyclic nucleotide-binding domain-containing protein [Myxococcales bacterium]